MRGRVIEGVLVGRGGVVGMTRVMVMMMEMEIGRKEIGNGWERLVCEFWEVEVETRKGDGERKE